jgi:hypothetical protein
MKYRVIAIPSLQGLSYMPAAYPVGYLQSGDFRYVSIFMYGTLPVIARLQELDILREIDHGRDNSVP